MLEIWHNPRCSKSRQALALLEGAVAEVRVRRYLEEPPTPAELDAALAALGMEPQEVVRWGEPLVGDLDLRTRDLSRAEWLAVLADNPILIERPVVLTDDGRAVIGRPPENVNALI